MHSRLPKAGQQLLVAFSHAPDLCYHYSYMQAYLHQPWNSWAVWNLWLQRAAWVLRDLHNLPYNWPRAQATQADDVAAADPLCFKGCALSFLRTLQRHLYDTGAPHQELDMLQFVMLTRRADDDAKAVLAQRIQADARQWFYTEWNPFLHLQNLDFRFDAGSLQSLLPNPVATTSTTRLYSAIVHGLGRKSRNEPAMGRMESLCFELVWGLQLYLARPNLRCLNKACVMLAQPSASRLTLEIAWAPHKFEYDGSTMKTTVCGANERTDFFLTATWPGCLRPVILIGVYHTTNVPESTFSGDYRVPMTETRLLASSDYGLLPALDAVVADYTSRARASVNLDRDIRINLAAQEATQVLFEEVADVDAPPSDASDVSSPHSVPDWGPEGGI